MGKLSEPSSGADPLVELAEEYAERYRCGERPALTEYTDKYPAMADRIRKLFPAMVVMEEFGSVAGPSTDQHSAPGDGTPPRQLGEYRILREVGRGGMGVVYEAVQESLGRHVALKVLPAQNWKNPTHLERFRREARAVARLHHTNIVPVFGVGESDGVHYYAMQFIQGQSLDSVLHELKRIRRARSALPGELTEDPPPANGNSRHRPAMSASLAQGLMSGQFPDGGATPAGGNAASTPPTGTRVTPPYTSWGGDGRADSGPSAPADASNRSELTSQPDAQYFRGVARIGVQAAEALAYAHGQGILHRDIKPGNLILDTQGAIWVTDFGLAKAQDSEDLTSAGDIVGTIRYMAPERFQGHADARSDVFALGLTLYEMLTLRPAFDYSDRARLIDRITRESPPAPRKIDPRIPRDLETVVLKAVAKEPGARYPTAAALAEDLERLLADRPIRARRTTWAEHGWRWCRRNPAVAGLLTAVAALLVVTVVVLAVSNARISGALEQEKQAKDVLVQTLYYQWVGRAAYERTKHRPAVAEELLDQCPPHLRGWEWHYVKRLPFTMDRNLKHGDIINRVVWSADGGLIASGSMSGLVKIWNAQTGELLKPIDEAQKKYVRGLAFSPDGRFLATGGEDDTVKVWDISRPDQPPVEFPTGPTMLLALEFSPDGRHLAAATQDWEVRVWDVAGRAEVRLPDDQLVIGGLAFTPDGRQIITVNTKSVVNVWDVAAGHTAATFSADSQAVGFRVTFSQDRRLLAIGYGDGTLKVIRTEPLEEALTLLEAHAGEVSGVAFGAGDTRLASTGDDLTVKIWDLRTGKQALSLDFLTRRANSLAFSPDGHRLAVGSADGFVQILDGEPLAGPGDAGQLLTWDGHEHAVVGLAYSPDGRRIVSGSRDGTAKVWEVHTGREVLTFRGHRSALTGVAWIQDGRWVASASWDGTVRVWDPTTRAEVLPPLDAKAGPVYGIAFNQKHSALATAHHDGSIRIWNSKTGQERVCIESAHDHPVLGVAFSPDGERLVSAGGGDNFVKVWDWQAGPKEPVRTLTKLAILRNPVFSPDGRGLVAVITTPPQVCRWDMNAATNEGKPQLLLNTWRVSQAIFRPGGRLAVVSSGRVQFLEPDRSEGPALIGGHAGEIGCAAFSPDGKQMATGAGYKGRGEVRIWDVSRLEKKP